MLDNQQLDEISLILDTQIRGFKTGNKVYLRDDPERTLGIILERDTSNLEFFVKFNTRVKGWYDLSDICKPELRDYIKEAIDA